ncbi:MAG TPA: DUF1883 domain-containing protein [Isosphaeraceae bacterium]|jgi:hypothetical protein|nr:DUF1883 domain-containing protein [Isosphaeraceae bacterium]
MAFPHLHQEFDAGPEDVIEVTLDNSANVQLLDEANYQNYVNGRAFRYHGGFAEMTPFRLRPPRQGHWHLVIDLGGGPGQVRAFTKILPGDVLEEASGRVEAER